MNNGSSSFAARGGWWVVCQGVLMSAVFALGMVFRVAPGRPLRVAAVGLLGLAAGVGLAGAAALGGRLTPFPRPVEKGRLVQNGIYGLIRHPLYTSVMSGLWGWALFWGSWPAGVAAGTAVVFFWLKARREERWLRERFAEYAVYERRVKRFVPWVW